MTTLRSIAVWLFVIVGCSTSSLREATYAACSNEVDNDGDGLADCRDPDCQAYEHCRSQGDLPDPPVAGQRGVAGAPPTSSWDGGGPRDDDAGTSDDEDASVAVDAGPPSRGCPGGCGPHQVCMQDRCQTVSAVADGRFTLRVTSAGVPYFDDSFRCFDDFCDNMPPSPPYGFCLCAPDAMVQLVRVRGGDELVVGRTPPAIDDDSPDFTQHPFTVDLQPGDALRLSLWDDDLGIPERLYTCTEDIAPIPSSGTVSCGAVVFGDTQFTITAEIEPAP